MKFVDLGCCMNLMFNDYDKWESLYYGVDISSKTIQCLNDFVKTKNLTIGSLFCGSINDTPFPDNHFDIASCIGILEYFEEDFVETAIIEAYRILKPAGRFVLDIPNLESPVFGITKLIEEYMGRPDKFEMNIESFNTLMLKYFDIMKTENVAGMIQYYLVRKHYPSVYYNL